MDAHLAVEQAARDSYSRLVAFLAARSRDLAAAEDALADAFQAALETWPQTGVPEKPEAWLLTAARRRLIDGDRRIGMGATPSHPHRCDQELSTLLGTSRPSAQAHATIRRGQCRL